MGLEKLTDKIFYMPHQPEFDRPMLVYIKGDVYSLAVDAGYSYNHVEDFYGLLDDAGLKKPDFTAITHWHYDHTFGMHHVNGVCIAHVRTEEFLKEQMQKAKTENYVAELKREDIFFAREYEDISEVKIVLPKMVFDKELSIDLGGVTARIFHTQAPHTEDSVCIYIPDEKVLFLGDCICEDYFNGGYMDKEKLKQVITMIEDTDCEYCILSHDDPLKKVELLEYLYGVLGDYGA